MRIRFISSTPMNVFQGSGTYVGIEALARSIRDLGVQVDMVTPRLQFPVLTAQRLLFNQALRFHRRKNYDVTVGFDMDGHTIAGADPNPHVASIKGVIADEMRFESGLTKMTMRLQADCEADHVRRADLVMTTSAYAAGQIRQLYGVSQPPRIVPELIDLAAWEHLALNSAAPPVHKFIVLTVCRFYPRKRLPVLLAAADRLRSRIRGLEVRIVGGGPEENRLRAICREKNLEKIVVWRHNLSGPDLAREYSQCHLFCLPSVQEGFGIVFLEAMANGKAVVAARAGAAPEVVRHGLLAEPDNDQELADAIERLYREPLLRESMGNAGREFVRRFDAPVVGRMFLRELEEFMALRADTARRAAS
ncbi:MAG: glycosyltransferase [Terriglobales bacterium]|jgi:glycosyltransferase involved in cell wall biosynthesis